MSSRYRHGRGRKANGRQFAQIWKDVGYHPNFNRLSGYACKLWVQIVLKYNGFNNGNLSIPWSEMSTRGWKSKSTLHLAIAELIHYGLIVQVVKGKKYGGKHYPSLYARTDMPLDDNGDVLKGTRLAPNTWKDERPEFVRPRRKRKNPKY